MASVPFVMWWLGRHHPQAVAAHRFVLWLLTATAAIHAGLALGHEWSFLTVLFAADAVALAIVVRRIVLGRTWRLAAGALLLGGVLAYSVSLVAGHPPDQVGLATKLVELAALAVVLRPQRRPTAARTLVGSTTVVALVVVTGLAAWIGAFVASEAAADGSHHDGAMPFPSVVIGPHEDREATPTEAAAAKALHAEAVAVLEALQGSGRRRG